MALNQNPGQIARDKIDDLLKASGWSVQDKNRIEKAKAAKKTKKRGSA